MNDKTTEGFLGGTVVLPGQQPQGVQGAGAEFRVRAAPDCSRQGLHRFRRAVLDQSPESATPQPGANQGQAIDKPVLVSGEGPRRHTDFISPGSRSRLIESSLSHHIHWPPWLSAPEVKSQGIKGKRITITRKNESPKKTFWKGSHGQSGASKLGSFSGFHSFGLS
jgi:hypothetical protein